MNASLVKAIVSYGNRYRKEELEQFSPDELIGNWWSALAFFFYRASFQGRLDTVSFRVYQQIVTFLAPQFSNDPDGHQYRLHRNHNWEDIRSDLQKGIGKGKVGKARDIDMVLSALEFVGKLPEYNIVAYTVQRVKHGELADHYLELQKNGTRDRGGIVQVGPKVASFYLRDIVSIFQLGDLVTNDAAFYLHPVDVWVRKLLTRTGVIDNSEDDSTVRHAIVAICNEHECSPVEFNQGAWYIGYYAFDLLLERLNETN